MKIIVTAQGNDLDAPTSPRFGRCPTFILVDPDSMAYEALPNPAMSTPGGAGIQAAQFVVERGAKAVLTANVGPNAMEVLQAADVPVYLIDSDGGAVRQVVEAYQAGKLSIATGANVPEHAGMSRRGSRPAGPTTTRQQEIADLQKKAADLRQQLADIMTRIENLEKES